MSEEPLLGRPPVAYYGGIPVYEAKGAAPFAILSRINAGLQSEAWALGVWDGHKLRIETVYLDDRRLKMAGHK